MAKLILKDGTELVAENFVPADDYASLTFAGSIADISQIASKLTEENLSEFKFDGTEYRQYKLNDVNADGETIWFGLKYTGMTMAQQISDLQEALTELYEMQMGGNL